MMKKLIAAVFSALLLLSLLASCGSKGGASTPGNLNPTANPTPHLSTGEKDVSSDYFRKLCSDYWLDTSSMECCKLNDDGTYAWYPSKKATEQSASGNWRLTRDDQNYLSLYLVEDSSGSTQILHEIELYEESIYAVDEEGNAIVWLTTTRSTEKA